MKRRLNSLRLKGHDYAHAGFYFVTMCTKNRRRIFGEITQGTMRLSAAGQVVRTQILGLTSHYPHVKVDTWVIMPDHVHVLFAVQRPQGPARPEPPEPAMAQRRGGFANPPVRGAGGGDGGDGGAPDAQRVRHGISEVVRALKTYSARAINELRGVPGKSLWARGFHDRIVRDFAGVQLVRQYIRNNPKEWERSQRNISRAALHPPRSQRPVDHGPFDPDEKRTSAAWHHTPESSTLGCE